jgi:predicted ribosome quality control (RQC) complex YloA/Tae2 family protein
VGAPVPAPQAELVAGGCMKPPPDAALASKAATKARKAQRRAGGGSSSSTSSTAGGSRDFRRYTSPSGFAVLIGRNSRQNDELSCKLAQGGDVWMHARGVPGAHLLLRIPAGQAAADEDLQCAADLAAFFSRSRGDGRVDVTACDPRHLSKPTGAKPGQVLVRRESVLVGRPHQSMAAQQGKDD